MMNKHRIKGFNEAPAKSGGESTVKAAEIAAGAASMRPPRKAGGNGDHGRRDRNRTELQ